MEYKSVEQPDVCFFFQLLQNMLMGNPVKLDGRLFFVKWEGESPVIFEHIKDTGESMIAFKKDYTLTELYDMMIKADKAVVVHMR